MSVDPFGLSRLCCLRMMARQRSSRMAQEPSPRVANLECKVVDTRLASKFNLFILKVIKAWVNLAQKHPKTIHHHGYGRFAVDGEMIRLGSRKP
jgi:flavin reductase (DIM6/NTAB) family NADH-FMN oxidoreductase RutF